MPDQGSRSISDVSGKVKIARSGESRDRLRIYLGMTQLPEFNLERV